MSSVPLYFDFLQCLLPLSSSVYPLPQTLPNCQTALTLNGCVSCVSCPSSPPSLNPQLRLCSVLLCNLVPLRSTERFADDGTLGEDRRTEVWEIDRGRVAV